MHDTIIIRYSEIGLKGKNRHVFENRLIENIRKLMKNKGIEKAKTIKKRGRIYIETPQKLDFLKNVFGISSFSYALSTEYSLENIKKAIDVILKNKEFKSFRITSTRIEKSTKESSSDLNIILGKYVAEKYNKKVSLKQYDINIFIEIYQKAYVFLEKIKAVDGLPIGTAGNIACIIESNAGISSCLNLMSRGCNILLMSKNKALLKKAEEKINMFWPFIQNVLTKSIEESIDIIKQHKISAVFVQNIKYAEFLKKNSFLVLTNGKYEEII